MASNKKPKKKYNPARPESEYVMRKTTDKKSKSGMTREHTNRLHHPIDMAIHRLHAGCGSVVDLHNVLYRGLVGKMMAEKFLIPEDQKFFNDAYELILKIKRRCESTIGDPRFHVWSCNDKEHAVLCELQRLVIEMHEEIHRKHFIATYKAVAVITKEMIKDFEARFPNRQPARVAEAVAA